MSGARQHLGSFDRSPQGEDYYAQRVVDKEGLSFRRTLALLTTGVLSRNAGSNDFDAAAEAAIWDRTSDPRASWKIYFH